MQLKREEYEEPACLLNMNREPAQSRIPITRIISKLDTLLGKKEYDSACRLLKNWLDEADAAGDRQGRLAVLNEQIGLYRKLEMKSECLQAIEEALCLFKELNFGETVTGATTCINAATGYRAFGKTEDALPLYMHAQTVYEKLLPPGNGRLAGLYNNMALTLTALKRYSEAGTMFMKAMDILEQTENSEPELAITLLNLADLVYAEQGPEEGETRIGEYLDRAEILLDSGNISKDGYFAYVCEKCAPVFGFYGYFFAEKKLEERAGKIRNSLINSEEGQTTR